MASLYNLVGQVAMFSIVFAVLVAYLKSPRKKARRPKLLAGALLVLLAVTWAWYFWSMAVQGPIFLGLVFFLFVYGVVLFISISEIFLAGFAQWLTKVRGEKWIKEMDYIYLLLGLFGVIGIVNRIEGVSGRASGFDLIAPMIFVTAVVIRVIKTRADIAGWNRLEFYDQPTPIAAAASATDAPPSP